MLEVRIDPLTGQRVIVAPGRADRPRAAFAVIAAAPPDPADDPFASGNESQTAPEIEAVRPDGSAPDTPGWQVRAVPNLYPALLADAPEPAPSAQPELFWAGPARGRHEVIVNAPEAVPTLADLSAAQVAQAVEMWRRRMRAHSEAACRHLVVNEGTAAGATQLHTHAQLFAFDFVPAAIARERERAGAYTTRTMGGNLLADLVQQEVRLRERVVAIDEEAVLLSAYAARTPYQMLLTSRTPRRQFEDDGPMGAMLLHEALQRLRRVLGAVPPLNLWVRTAPRGAESFAWRIDILPHLLPPGGVELGAGLHVNPLTPEAAAAELAAAA